MYSKAQNVKKTVILSVSSIELRCQHKEMKQGKYKFCCQPTLKIIQIICTQIIESLLQVHYFAHTATSCGIILQGTEGSH